MLKPFSLIIFAVDSWELLLSASKQPHRSSVVLTALLKVTLMVVVEGGGENIITHVHSQSEGSCFVNRRLDAAEDVKNYNQILVRSSHIRSLQGMKMSPE